MDIKKLQIGTLVALCLVAICLSVIAIRISMVAIDSQQNQTPTPTQSQIPAPTESATITAMVERVNASVVNISATEPADFVLNSVHWRPKSSREQEGRYDLGTGIVIDAENGYLVTVQHVIRESKGIVVTLHDGRDFEATEVGYDSLTDIAVLKIETDNLQALMFGNSDTIQVGESVVAIGNPLGLHNTVTAGIVSGLGREGLGFMDVEGYIQTDATTNIGSSGGPLLSSSGEFIGINIAGLAHTGSFIGIGFAIPSNLVSNILEQLIALDGLTTREHFGIEVTSVDKTESESRGLKENGDGTAGVKVTEVFEGTLASEAGIKENDVITSFRNKPISNMRDFLFQLKISQIEELVPIEIRRGTDVLTVYALIAPPMFDGDRYHWTLSGSLLMKVEFLDESSNENSELVEVVSIRPNSQASKIGLAKGDVIVGVTEHSSFGPSANVRVSREGSFLNLSARDD